MTYKKPQPIQADYQPSPHMWLAEDGWHWPEVYAMQLTNKGKPVAVKVGMSGDVDGRCVALHYEQCHPNLHRKIEIAARYECRDARDIEREAHRLLAEKRIEGEWFDCTADDARTAIEQAIANANKPRGSARYRASVARRYGTS